MHICNNAIDHHCHAFAVPSIVQGTGKTTMHFAIFVWTTCVYGRQKLLIFFPRMIVSSLRECITPDYSPDVISLWATKMVFERIQIDENKSEEDSKNCSKQPTQQRSERDARIESRFGKVRTSNQTEAYAQFLVSRLQLQHRNKHKWFTLANSHSAFFLCDLKCANRHQIQKRNESWNEHINKKISQDKMCVLCACVCGSRIRAVFFCSIHPLTKNCASMQHVQRVWVCECV